MGVPDAPLLVSGSGYTSHATQSLTIDVAAVRATLVDPNEDTFPPEMSEIQRVMARAPAQMPVARWHFLAGLELLMGCACGSQGTNALTRASPGRY